MVKIILGGEAEVRIYDNFVEKIRIKKRYRIKELDDVLRKRRTVLEARIISNARKHGVPTPIIFDVEDCKITMERIGGEPVRYVINRDIALEIGKNVAKLHSAGIIHGDLTPINMILKDGRIYFIDFGLAYYDDRAEAKGVDIHVFYEALKADFENWKELWNGFLDGYSDYEKFDLVIERFHDIEMRGRYVDKSDHELQDVKSEYTR